MINEKKTLTGSWLSVLLSLEIFISTGEWGVQMPLLTYENSHFLRSGPQEATLVMGSNSKILIVKFINIQNIWLGTHCEIAVRWMPQNITNEESSFVAWCRQATSRYLSQYWPVNRPQWSEVGIVVSFTE